MPEVLPDLGALGAALVLVLIAAGLWIAAELIRQSFGRLPLVGGWVGSNIAGALNDAARNVLHWAANCWNFAIQFLITIGSWCWRLPQAILTAGIDTANFLVWVKNWLIPDTANRVSAYAYGLYRDGLNFTSAVESWAGGYIASAFAQAEDYAARLAAGAVSFTQAVEVWAGGMVASAISQAASYAYGLYAGVWNYATSLWTGASAAIAGAEATAIAHADGIYAAVETDLSNLAGQVTAQISGVAAGVTAGIYTDLESVGTGAVGLAWPGAAGDIGALRGVLGNDFPDIQALLPWLAGAGAAGLSGALIRSLAGSAAVTRLAAECVVPNCRNLSQFGQDLQGLIGDVPAAAMLAWLAFLVADPAGWAADTEAVARPVTDTALGAARTLLGV